MALQIRRGTNAQRLGITPEVGEIIYTTDTKLVYIGDGTTVGGVLVTGSAGGIADGDKGDITVSSSGATWTIDSGVIGTAKLGGDITTAGKALLDDADASAQRTTLGLGTAALSATGDFAAASHTHAATAITSGTFDIARIPTGTTSATVCIGNDTRLSDARTPTAHTHAATDVTTGTFDIGRIPTGTSSTTVCIGNDARLSDARPPTAHNHSATDITVGVLNIARIPTGTTSSTVCIGNDSRLSDARTPTTHTHTTSDITGLGTLATQNGTFSGTSSGTNTGDQTITLTGEVTGSGTGSFAATIANGAVTPTKLSTGAPSWDASSNVTVGNNLTVTSNTTVKDVTETVVAIGTVGTSHTFNIANGTVQTATLTASTATTFTMPAAAAGKGFTLFLRQAESTGDGTATFTGVKWNSTTPTITATAGKMDIVSFVSDGTNWYGSIIQGYTP